MPWLQLEDEDLDMVGNIPPTPKKTAPPSELDAGTILVVSGGRCGGVCLSVCLPVCLFLQNGKELSPQELAKKKSASLRGSFQYSPKGELLHALDMLHVHVTTSSHTSCTRVSVGESMLTSSGF